PPQLSPSSLRNELESDVVPDPSSLIRAIGQYLESVSEPEFARSSVTIDDAIERDKRERSIVVQGLPESCAEKASERVAEDLSKVTAMLDLAELEHTPATVFRMVPNPVITSAHPSVYIRPSLTKEEREAAFQLRQRRRQLKAQGKDVIVYAGELIERNQLESFKKNQRS
ncbi:hypothetical protein PENTCL1PPCAC_4892, partial [Pristionchus entomophagus]